MNKSKIEMTKGEAIDYLSRCANGLDSEFDGAVKLAVAALQTQIEAECKEPLTLDEQGKMDGEPVWICPPSMEDGIEWDSTAGEWALVDIDYELCRAAKGDLAVFENCGVTWLACRHKPMEVQNERSFVKQ